MEKGSQHIAFDKLLALYHKELSLKEVHQYKKHLETCEICQDLLDGIEAFDTTSVLQPQSQYSEKPLEEKLLKINRKHIRQARYKAIQGNLFRYLSLLVASVLLLFFFPVNISQLGKIDNTIQAENKAPTPTPLIHEADKNIQTDNNEHFIDEKKSNNNLAKQAKSKLNTPDRKQYLKEKQTPIFNNLSKTSIASGLVEKTATSVATLELARENDDISDKTKKVSTQNKKLIIKDLEKTKIAEIPRNLKLNLAPTLSVEKTSDDKLMETAPVTPKFYAQYSLSYMATPVAPMTDEIPLTQRIQSDTLIGSKISEHLVDAYSDVTGLNLAFGCQFNRHLSIELGASYVYSKENLIDEEATNRNYDRLYVTNTRFTLSPAITLEASGKWRPFARFGLMIPVKAQTKRRQLSNEAVLVHPYISFVKSYPNSDFESNSIIKWRSSLGYNAALGLRYQINDNFDIFGSIAYTGLHIKGKTYKMSRIDLINNNDIEDISIFAQMFLNDYAAETYLNEKVNFSTVNLSIGARFYFGKTNR